MIYEGIRYGVFSNEADHIISLVRAHRPLSEVEGLPCPKCGERIRVGYYPDGRGFIIQCSGIPPHMSQFQILPVPPEWWKERVIEVTDCLDMRAE
jgi:hypothetical protein